MKPFTHTMATKEDRKNHICIGEPFKPAPNYTRSDFLTPSMVGKKFGISTKEAAEIMKEMHKKRSRFVLSNRMAEAIITFNGRGLHLHPLGLEVFQTYLDKQKG